MSSTNYTATDYYTASLTRNEDLRHLRTNSSSTIFSLYCAGVTIECMLRAYILKETTEFDSKHNLESLYEKSKMGLLLTDNEKESITAAVKIANKIWNNNLRYSSEKRLKRIIAHEIVRTNFKDIRKYLNNYYSGIFDSTEIIIKIGQAKWT